MGKEEPVRKGAGDKPTTPRPNFPPSGQAPKPAETQKN
jgi:hypothetical protein